MLRFRDLIIAFERILGLGFNENVKIPLFSLFIFYILSRANFKYGFLYFIKQMEEEDVELPF